MRITGPGATGNTSKTKKKGAVAGGDFGAALSSASGETSATANTAGGSRIEGIDALLALQEVGDQSGGANDKAAKRGAAILEQLEAIRDGLLTGRFSKTTLQRLAELVKQQKETFVDPHLQDILSDIELRAAVELAKYEASA